MASSVFADSPVSTNESRMCGDSHTNLVVVYGKNGINVDRNGLDSLLEDRNISSVSVVRLTSPTPSMKDEKEGNERIAGDDSDLMSSLEFETKNPDEEAAEIVGLTVEEFYPREEAKKLAKEILNYAGVANPLQIKIDYEFQRFVIQNDHCYTPLTSPSQSKPKMVGDSQASGESKPPSLRQYGNVNRIKKVIESVAEVEEKKTETDEEEEYSDYSDSSISDSDNDRDSDLDFNVNDRGRRRKTSTRKTRKSLTKTPKKRQSITERDVHMEEEQRKNAVTPRANRQSVSTPAVQKAPQKTIATGKSNAKPMPRLSISDPEKSDRQTPAEPRYRIAQQQPQSQQQISPQLEPPKGQTQKVYVVKKDPKPPVQILNNTTYTDINAVFTRKDIGKPIVPPAQCEPKIQHVQTPTTSIVRQIPQISHCSQIPTKGFMPLGVDTAVKNQLPAQISIQTHTSSTDLALENDKQLDLIDSIVKDEMQKTNVIVKNTHGIQDIPEIVKMLESTENTVMNKAKTNDVDRISTATTNNSFTNPDEHFDIANADLLDNPDDELYKDLLQHVAELRNEKHLQEVMDKQAFDASNPSPITIADTFVPITQPTEQPLLEPAIIEVQPPIAKKDPIKIVRGDGRVITLPPIEAPTTRAKRRAQSQHVTGSPTPDSSPKSIPIIAKTTEPVQRRESVDHRNITAAAKKRVSISSQGTVKEDEFDVESGRGSDSEDDPDKLWCVCRQPHNNRFMICCDKCEDWFHGTCVNITKAMGREMEQTGKEWTCPKCVKDSRVKKSAQKKITEYAKKTPAGPLKKQAEGKKSVPNFNIKKIESKKNIEAALKKPSLTGKKVVDMVKKIPSTPPPLVKSVEVIRNKPLESIPTLSIEQPQHQQQPQQQRVKPEVLQPPPKLKLPDPSLLNCIVCKKTARPNSIYCSDDCIRRHAQNALITVTKVSKAAAAAATVVNPNMPATPEEKKKKIPSSFEEALAKAAEPTLQAKSKIERVYVFERKTGRLLTGTNAPTTANLKKWLQDNPTFEVVQPGSPQALAIERSKQKQPKTPTTPDAPSLIKKTVDPKPELTPKVIKPQVPEVNRQYFTTQLKKYPAQVSIKPQTLPTASENKIQTPAKPPRKQNLTPEQKPPQPASTSASKETEPIRLSVRKTLKEQLIARMNELKLPESSRLTMHEIETFSNETENEMFKLFNKDCGTKYKAKYRSLMFNIKDRKNQTLFQKIMELKIQPKELVKMSPEELASQELAEWRHNENKHQLEMIKKSELDLLSCTKNYVLKTHKGEEVIESKLTDRVSLDIATPVEDVVTVLNNSAVSSTSEVDSIQLSKESQRHQSLSDLSQDADSSYNTPSLSDSNKVTVTSTLERKKSKKQERERERHYKPKDKHKSSRKRSRSRDRRHKSPHREQRRDSNREDKRETSSDKNVVHKRDAKKEEHQEKIEKTDLKAKDGFKQHIVKNKEKDLRPKFEIKSVETVQKDYNLVDQILESTKTVEQAANLVAEKVEAKASTPTSVSTTTEPVAIITTTPIENSPSVDSDQEPTSTVNITTSPNDKYKKYSNDLASILWSGSINMIDVATFQIVIQPVAGLTTNLEKQLPLELDVVGRISPETVWDYIGKIKKSPNKEIVIIRFAPSCQSENAAYSALYMYLDNRKRLGVVKTVSPNIKDFYILPLGAAKTLPTVLQPQENTEFFAEDTRPDILLGIIIRIMGKRAAAPVATVSSSSSAHHSQSKIARKSESSSVISNKQAGSSDKLHYTPPNSPKIQRPKKLETKSIISATRLPPKSDDSIDINTILAPPTKISKGGYTADDADEPYSPGGSTDDDELRTPVLSKTNSSSNTTADPMTDDLKRKMDEINRQIEAQKIEIAGMLSMEQKSSTYGASESPTGFKPALSSISIPSNLQQILASIKPSQDNTPSPVPPPPHISSLLGAVDEEYVPESLPNSSYKLLTAATLPPVISSNQSSSRLAQLSEAELLSMVPDGMKLNSTNTIKDSIRSDSPTSETAAKKGRWIKEPPPPGLEEEFYVKKN